MTTVANDERVQLMRVETRDGPLTFQGILLGAGTSRRESHWQHPPGKFARRGERCSGCRWSEVKIFFDTQSETYVISMIGRSVVPDEEDKIKTVWAKHPDDVVDALLVPPRHDRSGPLELPPTNADALDEAAHHDERLAQSFMSYDRDQDDD